MNIKVVITLIVLAISLSCSQQSSKTEMKVSFGAASDDFTGGIFVMGVHRQSGLKFIKQLGSSQIDLHLMNGTWDFASVGWDGGSNFEGDLRCGENNSISLNGAPVEVNVTLTPATCAGNKFVSPESLLQGTIDPTPYKIHSCAIFDRRQAHAQENLDLVSLCDEVNGNHESYKIVWWDSPESHSPFASKTNPFKSACISATNGIATLTQKIPTMNGTFAMPVTIEAFKTGNCSDSPEEQHFPNGILMPGLNASLTHTKADGTNTHALITDNICVGSALVDTVNFGNSNFTINGGSNVGAGDTAVICNKDQLLGIGTGSNPTVGAKYILGHDIDMTSVPSIAIGSSGSPFTGIFDGLGFKLSNFDYAPSPSESSGLFNYIRSAEIKNLKLENFDTDADHNGSTVDIGIGLLVGQITGRTSSANKASSIENIEIDNNSSIIFYNDISGGANGTAVGALVGKVFLPTSAAAYEEVNIRNIKSFASITYDFANNNGSILPFTKDFVGGVVGSTYISTPTTYGQVSIEETEVNANLLGARALGGIVGKGEKLDIRFGNKYTGILTGSEFVGGIVGEAWKDVRISSSEAILTIAPATAAGSSVNDSGLGGIAGYLGNNSIINGTVANLTINSTLDFDHVGGTVGLAQSTTAYNYILNSRAEVSIDIDGQYHGGIVGDMDQMDLGATKYNIQYSSAVGHIHQKDTAENSNNTHYGALAGVFDGKASLNILDVDIIGYSHVGLVGENSGVLKESLTLADVKAHYTGGSAPYAGTIVGLQTDTTNSFAKNIISEGNLIVPSTCAFDSYYCGMAFGKVAGTNPGAAIDQLLTKGDLVEGGVTDNNPTLFLNTTAGAASTYSGAILEHVEATFISSISSYPSAASPYNNFDSSFRLIFENTWANWGETSKTLFGNTETVYKTGSAIDNEFFTIASEDDWNNIKDDLFLMGKTFVLLNDLDFGSNATNFDPIGSTNNPFFGMLNPNGKKLKNITLVPNTNDYGVFNKVGHDPRAHAIIGFHHEPVIVENMQISLAGNTYTNLGFIGNASGARISARVSGDISATAAANVAVYAGGVVGLASNIAIESSSFTGSINMPNRKALGGLVGAIYQSNASHTTTITNSKVDTYLITGYNLVGGFVGQAYNSAGFYLLENNYVNLNREPNGASGLISATASAGGGQTSHEGYVGGFIGVTSMGSPATIKHNIVFTVDGLNGDVSSSAVTGTAVGEAIGDLDNGFLISPSGDVTGTNNPNVTFINNFYTDGTSATAAGSYDIKEIDNLSNVNIGNHFSDGPWIYDSNAGTLKLNWEQ